MLGTAHNFLSGVPPLVPWDPLVKIITEFSSTNELITLTNVSEDPKLTEPAIALIVLFPIVPAGVIIFEVTEMLVDVSEVIVVAAIVPPST